MRTMNIIETNCFNEIQLGTRNSMKCMFCWTTWLSVCAGPHGFDMHLVGATMRTIMEKGVVVPKVQTVVSCFGLVGPRQCSAALSGPATSNIWPEAPWGLKLKRTSKYSWVLWWLSCQVPCSLNYPIILIARMVCLMIFISFLIHWKCWISNILHVLFNWTAAPHDCSVHKWQVC